MRTLALAAAGVLLTAGGSSAAERYLQAQGFDKALPGGATVPMWGFASCTDATFTTCDLPSAPGPQVDLLTTDTLTIHLQNTLPVPVSVVIPGQTATVVGTPALGLGPGQSFAPAAAPSGGTLQYQFSSLEPGTYLYQSGTFPSVEVPMGLYGALVVRPATTACLTAPMEAYPNPTANLNLDSCHDADAVVLFSEIDAVQNQRVADAAAALLAPPTTVCMTLAEWAALAPDATPQYPCTVEYSPTHFLINGAAYDTSSPPADIPAGAPGNAVLLRFLNAGLRSHTPTIVGLDMALVAEDGHLYPSRKREAATLLAAGKTLDVLVYPDADATLPLYDRMLDLTNDNQPDGGMLAYLLVGAGSTSTPPTPVIAPSPSVSTPEDTAVNIDALGATALSSPQIVGSPAFGTVVVNGDNTFTYTPSPDFNGTDTFVYVAYSGLDLSDAATVTITVTPVNDAPLARDDSYRNTFGAGITVPAPGVLANDTDVDGGNGDTLTVAGTLGEVTVAPDGSFSYTGGPGEVTFTYTAQDSGGLTSIGTVTLTVLPVSGLTLALQDENGVTVSDEYRWLVEEDAMWQPDPSIVPPPADTLATNFHRSYMPVVAQGCSGGDGCAEGTTIDQLALDPLKHYYVTVLPATAGSGAGHTLGGARILPGQTSLTVTVNSQPLPPAQISVFVFEDNSPTNGAVDGAESGLGGFELLIEDAGGRYGMSGGPMMQDWEGNPLRNWLPCFNGGPSPGGVILTCPDTPANQAAGLVGQALIKNLYPGKYGVVAIAPTGGSQSWVQTSTIEGTKVIDAWVKAGEPAFFQEFGPAGWHVFIGFVSPQRLVNPGGANTVTGKVTNLHMSRPPDQRLWDSGTNDALAHTTAWVGLNSAGGTGPNFAAVQAGPDGSFTISNVPNGDYQLVVWDEFLDQIIAFRGVTLPGGGAVGNVPVFQWFARLEHNVFLDGNGDGVRDEAKEPGIPEQAVNLRFRDGSVYQSFPTDTEGFVPFDEVFPFFHWLVAELDFVRHRPTGVTVTVDGGGDVSGTGHVLNPQVGSPRTDSGPVLTEGVQGFLGQTSVFEWGKAPYAPGENGGISGIVYYASTRAESDPRLAVGEPWEPGIPRVTVRLYRETQQGPFILVDETQTDSWDDNLPTDCPGASSTDPVSPPTKCYDGLRNFNQVRPAVFDGGYAFTGIPPGRYIVEVVPPPGYELVKEEDVNVGFGDGFGAVAMMMPPGIMAAILPPAATVTAALGPEPGLAQPRCVGDVRTVPDYLSLFPSETVEAPFATDERPLCDRKEVVLADQSQAAADFFLFTGAPIAGHFAGMILDDVAQEFNVNSPQFGEKWAPPFVPVSVRDYLGREISRVYSDQWGRMNGLVPSTFTANMPSPSGYSPAMLTTCMNDPGPIPDPADPTGPPILDPQYNPAYSNFCYTFQYMPGTTTYLDTPVLPVSAFASGYNPPDCGLPDGTPVIRQVDGTGTGPLVAPNGTLTIHSLGSTVQVPNPAYEGPLATGLAGQKTTSRDYGFGGTQGTGSVTVNGIPLTISGWTADTIVAQVPGTATTGELVVTRANGKFTVHSATVTVSTETPLRVPAQYPTIQGAIDAAAPGSLILVDPGSYDELVIMWKPVRLQGAGAGSTFINAAKRPAEKIASWRPKMDCVFGIGTGCTRRVDALPGQPDGAAGFGTEEGAAITVLGVFDSGTGTPPATGFRRFASRIDGFSITGGDIGGGIFVNGYAHNLEIANNHVFGNSGSYHGGLRVGRPFLPLTGDGPFGFNGHVNIHHNAITQNGGLGGAGGGLSICTGTDFYAVSRNFVCGNFTTGDGGGIGHLGLSDKGGIANNRIVLNQSFAQGTTRSGGGLFIAGEPEAAGLTLGSGSVTVDANLIQGNHAGAGHGGGVRTQSVNGRDVVNSINPNNGRAAPGQWYAVTLTNNMIVNNVAGWTGGGVSLQDTARSFIVNNTVAHNDSTATVAAAFTTGNVNVSANQPAGISSEPHTAALNAAIPVQNNTNAYRNFSNPTLSNNIVWRNRSFYYSALTAGSAGLMPPLSQTSVGQCLSGAYYWDLGVLGGGFTLNPVFSVLTSTTGYAASNTSANPGLVASYCNGGRGLIPGTMPLAPGPMLALPALDEGGAAWIDVRYGPLEVRGNYHISGQTAGGTNANAPTIDFDGQARPNGTIDRGADEYYP